MTILRLLDVSFCYFTDHCILDKTIILPIGLSLVCIVQIISGTVLCHMLLLARLVIAADTVVHWHLLGKFLFTFRIYQGKVVKKQEKTMTHMTEDKLQTIELL